MDRNTIIMSSISMVTSTLVVVSVIVIIRVFEYITEREELPKKQEEWDTNYKILYDQKYPDVKADLGWTDCFDTFDLETSMTPDSICSTYSKTYDTYVIKENTKSDMVSKSCTIPDKTPKGKFSQVLCSRSDSAAEEETKRIVKLSLGERPVSKFAQPQKNKE